MNIVLIGYRGSGKSAVGRLVAESLGWTLVDTDRLIEQRAGKTIRDIFSAHGEPAFRDLEAEVIREAAAGDRQVISAGGGAILREENVQALRANGKLFWLTAPPEVLWQRIQQDTGTAQTRPNLTGMGGLDEVRTVLARRLPLYEAAAHVTIDVSSQSAAEAAAAIIAMMP